MDQTLVTIILIAVATSLLLANLLRIPQSTSQSTVLALMGPAIYLNILQTRTLFLEIIPTWFILPIISFAITYVIGRFIYRPVARRNLINFSQIAEHRGMGIVVLLACCYVAFSIGSNNVANAAGPLVSMALNELKIQETDQHVLLIMILATLVVAPCFGIGASLFGGRVVETTRKEIVEFGPLGATLVSTVTATLLLAASLSRGIPTSLVQLNTDAIIALGLTKVGWRSILGRRAVLRVATVWIVAPLISFTIAWLATAVLVALLDWQPGAAS